jgi:lipoprotein-releasing system permease protein
MNTEYFIARRYLYSRNKKFFSLSSVIAIGGIFIGVVAIIVTLSMMNGFQNELRRRILGATPPIIVRRYFNEPLENYQTSLNEVLKYPFVKTAAPFVITKSIIRHKKRVDGVAIKGVDGKLETGITDIGKKIVQGTFDLNNGCVIGIELAHNLNAGVGDTVIIALPFGGEFGMLPRAKRFILNGIFDFGYYDYNATMVYMNLKDAQSLFKMKGLVSGIELKVDDVYKTPEYSRIIEGELGYPYRAQDWIASNYSIFAALKIEKIITFIVLTLIILVAGFNIIGTLVNMVKKKTKEIGILRSYGFTSKKIMRIFIYHGSMIGIIGTALGIIFSFIACVLLDKYQISLPGDIYFIETLPVEMSTSDFVITAFAAIIVSFLATIYPAKRAAGLTTVDALRNE